jgi:heat shock protein HslJ
MLRRSSARLLLAGLLLSTVSAGSLAQSPPPAGSLEGTDWHLLRLAGSGVPWIEIPAGVNATLRIDGAQAGGQGGCNAWFADAKVDGDALVFGPVGSTMMACGEPAMSIEGQWLGYLPSIATWAITDGQLTLSDGTGAELLVFGAEGTAAALEGTDWRADAVLVDGVLAPIPAGIEVTLRLDGGQADGTAACNHYGGGYSVSGDSLTFGPLAVTEMACEEPRMSLESAFLAALGATVSYRLDGAQLHLLDASGADLAVLSAAGAAQGTIEGAWQLAEIVQGDMVALIQSDATVEFGADGSLTGSTGCNNLMSDYAVEGASLKVGPVATTKMACKDGSAQEAEAALLAALEAATAWEISPDGWLVLLGTDGAMLAGFTPATVA